jgi:hypothetical protein
MAFTVVKTFIAAAFCLATVAQAAGAPWQITDPVASTVWKFGDNVNIVWTTDGSIRASSIQIELLAGNTQFDMVAKSVAPNALKATYVVKKVPSSDQYYLRIGTGASDFTYSHTFSIQGDGTLVPGKLPPNTTAVITGGAAAPGAAPSAGAASGVAPAGAKPSAAPSASASADSSNSTSNSTSTAKSSADRPVHELKSISFAIALVAAVAFWGM